MGKLGKMYIETESNEHVNLLNILNRNFHVNPIILTTINYNEFTASGTVTKHLLKRLNRNIKDRVFVLFNEMDIAPTTQRFTMTDSMFGSITRTAGSTATSTNTVANNNCIQVIDSSSFQLSGNMGQLLKMCVDSVVISITIGETVPTKGKLSIGVIEIMD